MIFNAVESNSIISFHHIIKIKHANYPSGILVAMYALLTNPSRCLRWDDKNDEKIERRINFD